MSQPPDEPPALADNLDDRTPRSRNWQPMPGGAPNREFDEDPAEE